MGSLTHHVRVLMIAPRAPAIRIRDIAATCDIAERTAQRIVTDLEAVGDVSRERVGQTNRYAGNRDGPPGIRRRRASPSAMLELTVRQQRAHGQLLPTR